jgi:hypothetical protein
MKHIDKDGDAKPSTPRKPYAPPKVVSYGHVKDIIQGGGGMKADAGPPVGGNSKSCWIAEALYGVHDPRTLLLRAWLSVAYDERRPGWWLFIALYRRFGRATADLIQRGYLPRQIFQPLFDVLVEKALTESAHAIVAARH